MGKPFEANIAYYPEQRNSNGIVVQAEEPKPDFLLLSALALSNPDQSGRERALSALNNISAFSSPDLRSEARRKIRDRIVSEVQDPTNQAIYQSLTSDLVSLSTGSNGLALDPRLPEFQELSRRLEEEAETPEDISIRMRFERHALWEHSKFGPKARELAAEMRQILKLGQRNLVFLESAESVDPLVMEEYRKRGSLRAAEIAADVIRKRGIPPSETLLAAAIRDYENGIKIITNPIELWGYARSQAIDVLNQEGYNIEIVLETPTPESSPYYETGEINSMEDYKNMMINYFLGSSLRDDSIAKQLTELIKTMKKSGKPSNLFVLMGFAHQKMVDRLSPQVQQRTTTTLRPEPMEITRQRDEITLQLMKGQAVDNEQWGKGYGEYLVHLMLFGK